MWSPLTTILAALGVALIVCAFVRAPLTETFVEKAAFVIKKGENVYDDFYVSAYDKLFYDEVKNRYEIGRIVNAAGPTEKASVLDIGSATGHHVAELGRQGYRAVGLDKSRPMIKAATTNYPDGTFHHGDALDALTYPESEFTTITCLYYTVYEVKNRERFFHNCAFWLKPGGKLILHLVDFAKFEPIVPAADAIPYVGLQEVASDRLMVSNVVFDTHEYQAEYRPAKNTAVFSETWKCRTSGAVRKNERVLPTISVNEVLQEAQRAGFIVEEQNELSGIGYKNQYLCVLTKPN